MQDKEAIQNRATPIIGFVGLLIGLLVNAAITIELNEYDETIGDMVIITYLTTTFFLMMAAIDGISTYIEGPRDDLEKLVTHSCYWLAAGIAGIAMLIPATLFKTNTIAYILSIPTLLFALVLAVKYDNISIHESKTNQPPTEVEEQLKCADKENST